MLKCCLLVEARKGTLAAQDHGRGPEGNTGSAGSPLRNGREHTGSAGSRLRSGREHWQRKIAVEQGEGGSGRGEGVRRKKEMTAHKI